MNTDTQRELEKIFMSYHRALENFKLLNIKTRTNKNINMKDLIDAIDIMNEKHPSCRWKCQNPDSRKHYILAEGFYWLLDVYYQQEKPLIDADIEFFITRIQLYEELLNVPTKDFFVDNMYVYELDEYFKRKAETIRKAILKMLKVNKTYRFIDNGKYKISKEGIKWLCKNCFKYKYLELLEKYKMELTEKYIEAGYPYDIFLFKK